MQYVIGGIDDIINLSAQVDAEMGYPQYGTDEQGNPILPVDGQDPASVVGVTLQWQAPTPSYSDPTQGYLVVDSTNGPYVAYELPNYPNLTQVSSLPAGFLPPFP